MSDYDWNNDPDVVVPEQQAIAVFTNVHGRIAILQKADLHSDEDVVIVVNPENAAALARAILAHATEPEQASRLALPAPADCTAAERQRRYRERHRNGSTVMVGRNDTVTDRDSGPGENDLFVGAPARGGVR
jgi:hypothetical protein